MSWIALPFVDEDRNLRNGWWIVGYLVILALLLFPTILMAEHFKREVTIAEQVLIIALATVAIQMLRRKPLTEVIGRLDWRWPIEFLLGGLLGGLLMIVPALMLVTAGFVRLDLSHTSLDALLDAALLMAGVAMAEELLFRGVLFQRLIAGVGVWPAQVLIALLFLLTHLNNPGMQGAAKVWAGCNIFLASILFGLTFVRTRSLAMPIGLHFMANTVQGVVLGFGVSGEAEPGLLAPTFGSAPTWLTGGAFGLEASLPGLLTLTVLMIGAARFLQTSPRP